MQKTAVIHQPDFIPYLGFFHRLLHADLLIVLDHVQFTKGGSECWTHRDKIKTPNGAKWLTLPVEKCPTQTPINEILLSDKDDWRTQHLNIIKENYKRSPFFNKFFPTMEKLYAFKCKKMADFNMNSIQILLHLFNIDIEILKSSTVTPTGKSNEMLADLLQKVGAKQYISGIGALDYFDPAPFLKKGITVTWQKFEHPVYQQLHGKFVPYLSSIDLFFNKGYVQAKKTLHTI